MILTINQTPSFYEQVTKTLSSGQIIALPTDTIYGLAVDGTDKNAVRALAALKGRGEKPFTFFLPRSRIRDYVVVTKRKIIDYFIPGPLTAILKKKEGVALASALEKIGIRIPQVDFVIRLLTMYNKPLAVTSANKSGQPPLNSAFEIAEQFTGVALVIDGGTLRSQASTVLDLTTTPPTLLRKGAVPILEIEKVYGRTIHCDKGVTFNVLFVCSGNTCRSPMAEGILRTMVQQEYCSVRSAGTLPMDNLPPARYAEEIVEEYGGSLAGHRTQTISNALIEWADLILVMEYKHYTAVLDRSPNAAVKTFLLREYKHRAHDNKVFDPVGMDKEHYRSAVNEMLPSLRRVARDIERRFRSIPKE